MNIHVERKVLNKMLSSGMLCHVALVRTNVLKERSTSIIKVTRISELGTTLAITSNQRKLQRNYFTDFFTLMMEALHSSETSVLTGATQHNVPEVNILHSHHLENLKSSIALTAGLCSREVMCLLWGTNWDFISQKTTFFIVTTVKTSNL
jgi:hypothetical protein